MRADRLLSLLLLLQNRGRMSAPEIAAELEVSVRTVYRDVEALGASGVPVYADRGPRGGFALVDGYRTRLTGLSGTEAHALSLAGTPAAAEDLGLGAVLATAQLKLRAALPSALAERTRAVSERFHLDAPAWFREADEVPHLAALAGAVWDQRVVRVHYRRWRGEVHRELCPLGVVLKGGLWYLLAQVKDSGAKSPAENSAENSGERGQAPGKTEGAGNPVRTYRVSRFLEVEDVGEVFERPEGFDLAASWEESSRRLESAVRQGIARVRLSPRARALLPMKFGAAGTRALEGAGPPDAQGWVEADLEVEASTVAVGDLLSLGAEAEDAAQHAGHRTDRRVIERPPRLRDRQGEVGRLSGPQGGIHGPHDDPVTRAFLVEIPPSLMPPRMADRLFEFTRAGRVPVLAHPERYEALWDDDELARIKATANEPAYLLAEIFLGVDESSVRGIKGLVRVVRVGNFLGVVAESEWAAVRAAQQLKVTWSPWAELPDMAKLYQHVRATPVARDDVTVNRGDANAALAARYPSSTYFSAFPKWNVARASTLGRISTSGTQAQNRSGNRNRISRSPRASK